MEQAGNVARVGDKNVNSVLFKKPEIKRPFGRNRQRWEDIIKMYIREIVWDSVDCIHLFHDRCN
jgi:hypothetical protein